MAKERAVKCIVQLFLLEVQWNDSQGTVVHLDGPPVLVRVCLLGQLQHTHLHSPIFPIKLEQELHFERVVTNCRNPLLFGEVIRGEHVHIELIQLSGDYKGGKVVARHEEKAHRFLFPSDQEDKLREVVMTKGRRYESPPRLVLTTSTTLTEAIVHSPLDATMPLRYSSSDETHSSLTSNSNNTGEIVVPTTRKASGMHKSVQTESTNRQRTALDYSRLPRDKYGQISGESSSDEPVMRMPASTLTAMRNTSSSSPSDHSTPLKVKFQPKVSHKFGSSEQSVPHCHQCCPRRASLPPSMATTCHHSPSPTGPRPDHTQHAISPGKVEPFKCGGHVDKSLLSRREFPKPPKHKTRLRKNGLQASTSPATPRASANDKLTMSAPVKSSRQDVPSKPEPSLSELYGKYLNDEASIQLSKNYCKASPTPPFSPIPHTKYKQPHPPHDLKLQPGNKREGVDSPSHLIQQKVDRMLRDYCACRHDVDTLGNDTPWLEGDKLRASMAAQRNAGLANSQPKPDQRMTVSLGGGDYWSDKMAELTGKPHRAVFNDTMEKIYSRLYSNATSTVVSPKKGSLD